MKPSPLPCLLSLLLVWAAARTLPAATPVIGAQLFQETNARIEDMFQHRNNPPKPPGPADNPFRTGNPPAPVPSAGTAHDTSGPTPGTSDDIILRQAAAGLTFGGLLQVGDVQVLVINKGSYKQGGILSVRPQGTLFYLRILSITGNSITLGLNEARLTLHF